MHSKSDNIEFTICNNADEIIEELEVMILSLNVYIYCIKNVIK